MLGELIAMNAKELERLAVVCRCIAKIFLLDYAPMSKNHDTIDYSEQPPRPRRENG